MLVVHLVACAPPAPVPAGVDDDRNRCGPADLVDVADQWALVAGHVRPEIDVVVTWSSPTAEVLTRGELTVDDRMIASGLSYVALADWSADTCTGWSSLRLDVDRYEDPATACPL